MPGEPILGPFFGLLFCCDLIFQLCEVQFLYELTNDWAGRGSKMNQLSTIEQPRGRNWFVAEFVNLQA